MPSQNFKFEKNEEGNFSFETSTEDVLTPDVLINNWHGWREDVQRLKKEIFVREQQLENTRKILKLIQPTVLEEIKNKEIKAGIPQEESKE